MENNPIIQAMLNRKSVRKYKKDIPTDEVIHTIVRAGQQAPFASQLYSVLLSRKGRHPFGAPLLFTICVDVHKINRVMARRNWGIVTNDLLLLIFGIQDAALMAENMVMAGESLGLGSVFLGHAPYIADKIAAQYHLPEKVFPIVQLGMGYPDEEFPPRPRYPMEFVLFEDKYPEMDDAMVDQAMKPMDEGYLAQQYYKKLGAKIDLEVQRDETFTYENYSWTEHISRKWGQWSPHVGDLLEQFRKQGFDITGDKT